MKWARSATLSSRCVPGAQAEGGDAPGAVRELLAAGAAADAKNDDGMTPLMLAADAGRSACVAALVEGGAAVDTPALESHMTALHFAAQVCVCVCVPSDFRLVLRAGKNVPGGRGCRLRLIA
jgi:ankyrin repeat protein